MELQQPARTWSRLTDRRRRLCRPVLVPVGNTLGEPDVVLISELATVVPPLLRPVWLWDNVAYDLWRCQWQSRFRLDG
jgi:hypothetical protein